MSLTASHLNTLQTGHREIERLKAAASAAEFSFQGINEQTPSPAIGRWSV